MSKKKKVIVKLTDIKILDNGPHYAEWSVKGQYQCWIGRKELERIIEFKRTKTKYMKRLLYKLKT